MAFVTRMVILEDVWAALFDMFPHKAPGIDGFPAFVSKGWDSMKLDLLHFVSQLFLMVVCPKRSQIIFFFLFQRFSTLKNCCNFDLLASKRGRITFTFISLSFLSLKLNV